ncbi:MAG: hypothetical protein U1E46_14165 [Hyphomicrobiales bacterium]
MSRKPKPLPEPSAAAVKTYKTILADVLNARPSGTRQRLAGALGKNRSFVSQIANPQYATPIPSRHLETIFEVCHFSAAARERFLKAYSDAHPVRIASPPGERLRRHVVMLPDLGDPDRNAKLDQAVAEFVRKLGRIFEPHA